MRLAALLAYLVLVTPLHAQDATKALSPSETRKAFQKLLERPTIDPGIEWGAKATADGLITERFTFASQNRADGGLERVPVLVVRPEKPGQYPVMIVLHG